MIERGRDDPESTLRITADPWGEFEQEALENLRQIEQDESHGNKTHLNFEDPAQIQRLLTPKRLELLRSVMVDPPESIRALAARLDRNVSDVHEDVQLLVEYGVIRLEPAGRAKRPAIPFDEIHIEVRLAPPELGEGESTAEP